MKFIDSFGNIEIRDNLPKPLRIIWDVVVFIIELVVIVLFIAAVVFTFRACAHSEWEQAQYEMRVRQIRIEHMRQHEQLREADRDDKTNAARHAVPERASPPRR